MKQLITTALALAALFASTFVLTRITGLVTAEDIEWAVRSASQTSMLYVALAIVALLAADIVIAMPTLTLTIMAGYFLGFPLGATSTAIGMAIAGLTGYGFCRFYGPGLLASIYRNPAKLQEMQGLFNKHGSMVLLMCRAMPILPEVSCCMAGANRMPIGRFVLYYMIATLPYASIAACAGARSSLEDPTPAIAVAIAMTLSLWSAWLLFLRRHRRVWRISEDKPVS